jgi:hypothetical protein
MIEKITAILSLVPDAQVVIRDEVVEWINPSTAPVTDAQIDAEVARLQAEYDAKQYQRDRASEYPSIQEQMDMQYWDAINGTTTWQDAINAVKQKFPKGA